MEEVGEQTTSNRVRLSFAFQNILGKKNQGRKSMMNTYINIFLNHFHVIDDTVDGALEGVDASWQREFPTCTV